MRRVNSISMLMRSAKLSAFVVLVLLFLGLAFALFGSSTVTGKVISESTRLPIQDAMVYIHSEVPFEEDGFNSYVTTDATGSFRTSIRGHVSLIRVWKAGYAVRGVSAGSNAPLSEPIIKLRELSASNLVTEHQEFYNLSNGGGFSFAIGRSVFGDSTDADIVIKQDDKTSAYIESRGDGGILFQCCDPGTDFYNSPQAPDAGYEKRISILRSRDGIYFIRSRDGRHYAKFRLLVDLAEPFKGAPFLDFERCQLVWAYQPDGTRNLDIRPTKSLGFPVEKFGLQRDSLGN